MGLVCQRNACRLQGALHRNLKGRSPPISAVSLPDVMSKVSVCKPSGAIETGG